MSEHMTQLELNQHHKQHPQPGDYWVERLFSKVCVVIQVLPSHVILCSTAKAVTTDHWTWDLAKLEMKSKEEFAQYLSYASVPGKTWCDVRPGQHIWAVEEALGQSQPDDHTTDQYEGQAV